MSEAEFGALVLAYLRARGWKCYSEVELAYGATTDIVAIRKRRVVCIELKLTLCRELQEQVTLKRYGGLPDEVCMAGIVPRRSESSFADMGASRCFALEDGQMYIAKNQWANGERSTTWEPCPDIQANLRYMQADYLIRPSYDPVDARWLSMFDGEAETDGAGSPTGSKSLAMSHLACNFARCNAERLRYLKRDELAHVARMWLPYLPTSYADYMRASFTTPPATAEGETTCET